MITKKELKDIKEKLRELHDDIEKLMDHEDISKLTITWGKADVESPGITIGMFLPRLQWMNKRLDKWIDKAPAGKRGPKKKTQLEDFKLEINASIEQMNAGEGIPIEIVKDKIVRRRKLRSEKE